MYIKLILLYMYIDETDVSITPSGYLWPLHQRVKRVRGIIRLPDTFTESLDSLTRLTEMTGTLLVSLSRITPDFPIVIRGSRTNALISTCHPQSLAPIFLGEFASKHGRIERVGAKDELQKTWVLAQFQETRVSSLSETALSLNFVRISSQCGSVLKDKIINIRSRIT